MPGPSMSRDDVPPLFADADPTPSGLFSGRDGEGCDATAPARAASLAERELAEAIREYQRASGRMFPTWSEVLGILRGLGYRKPEG